MKRKLITILAIFLPFFGAAQTIIGTGNPNQLTYQRGGYGADSVMAIPVADTSGAGATWANYRKIGRIMVNDADSTLYYHDGVKWKVVGGGGTSDTNFIRNQFAYRQEGDFRINGVGEAYRMIVEDLIYKPGSEGAGKILTSSADGTVNISDPAAVIGGEAFLQNGNAFGETAVLGTTDNEALEIIAGGNTALRVNPDATVQYTDGTEGDGKILMSSADGTLSAQSADSVVANSNAWINGRKDFGAASNNHARLWAAQDTVSMTSGFDGNTFPAFHIHGRRIAIGDYVRTGTTSFRVVGISSGAGGTPAISMEGRPTGGGGPKIGTHIVVAGYGETVPAVINLAIGRAGTNRPIPHYIGIAALHWSASPATTNYFIHSESFQPSSTNWFLFGNNPVKSQLAGNLLLNKVADNGYKLQVGEGGVHVESPGEPEKQLVLTAPFTPGNTADAKGEVGAITWDNDYLYIKTTAGWKRAALSTF